MKEKEKENLCKDCPVKSGSVYKLSNSELEMMCKNSTEIIFDKGERIIKQGSFTQNVVFIKSGIVKIHLTGPIKKDEILKIEKGPFFVGVPDVFANKIHTYSATSLSKVTACFIDYRGYEYLVENNGRFALEIIRNISENFVNYNKLSVNKIQKQLTAILAETLIYFADHIFENDEFNLPLTRTELGQYIGTTRETVTKIIHDFTTDNIIEVEGKKIKLINKKFLSTIEKAG